MKDWNEPIISVERQVRITLKESEDGGYMLKVTAKATADEVLTLLGNLDIEEEEK